MTITYTGAKLISGLIDDRMNYPNGFGNFVDGTPTGITKTNTGKLGNAWSFANSFVDSGNADYVAIPNALEDAWYSSGKLTINFWIYRTSGSTDGYVLTVYDSSTVRGIEISCTSAGKMNITSGTGGGGSSLNLTTTTTMSATTWYMVTVTIDITNSVQTDHDVKFWINGSSEASSDSFTAFGTRTSAIYLATLAHEGGKGYGFNGRLDELSVWDRPLTSTEITALYNSGSGSTPQNSGIRLFGLKAYYDFEETSGNLINKAIPSQNVVNVPNGTIFTETDTAKTYWHRGAGGFPTFLDNFKGSDAWSDADSAKIGVNTTTDVLDITFVADSTNDSCSYDLTSTSDTAWVLRFKVNYSSFAGTAIRHWYGLSSHDSASSHSTAQDFIGLMCIGTGVTNNQGCQDTDGATLPTGTWDDSTATLTLAITTDYYVQIKRTSATAYNVSIFSDPNYSVSLASWSGTCASTTQTLRYIVFRNENDVRTSSVVGTIDNIRFYNGVTSI